MDKLTQTTPCAGLLPLHIGALTVAEANVGPVTSVTPFSSPPKAAFNNALGLPFPAPNQYTFNGDVRCIWVGQGEAFLIGVAPKPALGKHAAVVDQSDARACVTISGPDAVNVLARLVPIDLREGTFKRGHTARTMLQHMVASITRVGADRFLILVFRSMAGTLVHDLKVAMEAVASRR